jgi:hypothetical protein
MLCEGQLVGESVGELARELRGLVVESRCCEKAVAGARDFQEL